MFLSFVYFYFLIFSLLCCLSVGKVPRKRVKFFKSSSPSSFFAVNYFIYKIKKVVNVVFSSFRAELALCFERKNADFNLHDFVDTCTLGSACIRVGRDCEIRRAQRPKKSSHECNSRPRPLCDATFHFKVTF